MTIDAPVAAMDVLGHFVVAEPGGRMLRASDTAVAVGPEGGWSASELAVCRDRIDLGPTILRTETVDGADAYVLELKAVENELRIAWLWQG